MCAGGVRVVERRSPKPLAAGSSPVPGAIPALSTYYFEPGHMPRFFFY